MNRNKKILVKDNNSSKISTNYEVFRQKIIRKSKRSINLFKAHLFSFISLNTFLIFLNIATPGSYPWFLYPLGSMSILLSLNYASKKDRLKQKLDIGKYPILSDRALKLLKKIFRKRRFTILSNMLTVSISAFLFMINIITGPDYLWATIPTASLIFLNVILWFFNKQNKKELIENFHLSIEGNIIHSELRSTRSDSIELQENHPSLIEAYSLKKSIRKQLEQIGLTEDQLIDTIPELVDNYIMQIKTLLGKNEDFTSIITSNPDEKLIKGKKKLSDKMNNSDNDKLVNQYKTAILELDNHLAANRKIANQIEIFTLQISSALNSIRMLHLDLANLNVENMSHSEVMKALEEESAKLSERLEDLKSSFSELEKENK